MTLIALTAAPGNIGVTTTTLLMTSLVPEGQQAVMAECDPSGGDVAGWVNSTGNPSWVSAVASSDRSWEGFCVHLQRLPSEQRVMTAPARITRAATSVSEAADRFGPMLTALSDVIVFADCGRMSDVTTWHRLADLVIVVAHQDVGSAYATVSRIDRTIEIVRRLHQARCRVGLLIVGERPYAPDEIAQIADVELLGSVPDDPSAAALVAGAWTLGKGPGRSRLAKAMRPVTERIVDSLLLPAMPDSAAVPDPTSFDELQDRDVS